MFLMSSKTEPILRHATLDDQDEIAELICISTNYWYRSSGKPPIFNRGPETCRVFWDIYEAMDPGRCIVAVEPRTGRLMGSCFYHARQTHYSLGIMNAHPNYFGRGVAGRLLKAITDLADAEGKPIRLVSSAMNLDSFSLYTRAGFSPRAIYHDMIIPAERVVAGLDGVDRSRVRPAVAADVPAIAALEWKVSRIRRDHDWRHMIENKAGVWSVWVSPVGNGELNGAGVDQPSGQQHARPWHHDRRRRRRLLIAAELTRRGGTTPPLFLAPAARPGLIRKLYDWGAKNIELHLHQVRGESVPFDGVAMQTFMPETG